MKLTLTDEQIAKAYSAFMWARVAGPRNSIEAMLAALPELELAEPTETEIVRLYQVLRLSVTTSSCRAALRDLFARRKRPASKRDRADDAVREGLLTFFSETDSNRRQIQSVIMAKLDAILGGE